MLEFFVLYVADIICGSPQMRGFNYFRRPTHLCVVVVVVYITFKESRITEEFDDRNFPVKDTILGTSSIRTLYFAQQLFRFIHKRKKTTAIVHMIAGWNFNYKHILYFLVLRMPN